MQLRVQGLCHYYGDLHVLDDIELAVREGETLALIGPSGCGKSTLLGIMGGMLQPTGGKVEMLGELPDDCLNPFTYVFQDFALLPWRTVEGNVALALEHHPLVRADRDRRVRAALEMCGLSEFARAYPKQLSGGMRQRVGIARALVVRPAVLFLDEPLSALDAQTRDLLMDDLLAIWARERTTSIYVTHNLMEALRLADRVAVLSRRPGRLRQIVTVDIPPGERTRPEHGVRLAALHDSLWESIKDEAKVADREVQDA